MSAPPPYESEFEVLLSNLTALDITHPGDPDPDSSSARPQARASVSTPNSHGLYHYESPTKSGYTNNCSNTGVVRDEAADATQGVAGTRPRLLTPKKKFRPRTKKTAYAVFFGRAPGLKPNFRISVQEATAAAFDTPNVAPGPVFATPALLPPLANFSCLTLQILYIAIREVPTADAKVPETERMPDSVTLPMKYLIVVTERMVV
ncbi:hypothetical protein C8R44DRAFT_739756 [Mycena epipterygia]|nr:hypothetical protein C8R44DRAFT_739756 [Mycena epipterygia]